MRTEKRPRWASEKKDPAYWLYLNTRTNAEVWARPIGRGEVMIHFQTNPRHWHETVPKNSFFSEHHLVDHTPVRHSILP